MEISLENSLMLIAQITGCLVLGAKKRTTPLLPLSFSMHTKPSPHPAFVCMAVF